MSMMPNIHVNRIVEATIVLQALEGRSPEANSVPGDEVNSNVAKPDATPFPRDSDHGHGI